MASFELFFFFVVTEIERSHSVPAQPYTLDNSRNRFVEYSKMQLFQCVRARIVVGESDPSSESTIASAAMTNMKKAVGICFSAALGAMATQPSNYQITATFSRGDCCY